MPLSRRAFLAGAAGTVALAGCGSPGSPAPAPTASDDVVPSPTESGSFVSTYRRGVRTGWTIARPAGH